MKVVASRHWISAALVTGLLFAARGPLFAQAPEPSSPSDLRPRTETIPDGEFDDEREEDPQEEPLETDRDSFTPATTTATHGRIIFESAYTFLNNRGVKETHSLPEFLARVGVTDRLELRLGWNYEVGGAPNTASGNGSGHEFRDEAKLERESQVTYGLKYAVTDQDEWLPRSALILQGGTPTSGPDPATQFVGTYVWGWLLGNGWTWDSSMRYAFDEGEGDHFNLWAPSTVIKIPVHERWNAHLEYFGIFSEGRERETNVQYLSPGLHYLINPDLEVGVRVGWGLNHDAANFFSNLGVGWRY